MPLHGPTTDPLDTVVRCAVAVAEPEAPCWRTYERGGSAPNCLGGFWVSQPLVLSLQNGQRTVDPSHLENFLRHDSTDCATCPGYAVTIDGLAKWDSVTLLHDGGCYEGAHRSAGPDDQG